MREKCFAILRFRSWMWNTRIRNGKLLFSLFDISLHLCVISKFTVSLTRNLIRYYDNFFTYTCIRFSLTRLDLAKSICFLIILLLRKKHYALSFSKLLILFKQSIYWTLYFIHYSSMCHLMGFWSNKNSHMYFEDVASQTIGKHYSTSVNLNSLLDIR